jgi:transglycosylase-like protein with SLT domain
VKTGGVQARRSIGIAKKPGPLPAVLIASCLALALFMVLGAVVSVANPPSKEGSSMVCKVAGEGVESPPANLVPIYQAASEKYKLGPRGPSILASINFNESNFGTNMGPSSAGAEGWMQFMPETWEAYGVDANGDGERDPRNPWDAIFAAARYLHASGAPRDWYSAIFAYNHADWYVEDVMETARKYDGGVVCTTVAATPGLGDLPTDELERLAYVARWIEARRIHYCWGGGHAAEPGPSGGDYCWNAAGTRKVFDSGREGLDCSGAVRWLLVLSGYDDPGPIDSGGFAGAYESGPGRYFTIWANGEHVFVTINGHGWGTSSSNYAHGPGLTEHSTGGFVPRHLKGL